MSDSTEFCYWFTEYAGDVGSATCGLIECICRCEPFTLCITFFGGNCGELFSDIMFTDAVF